tara:strand:- start:2558 stop:2977 length:420 start_codon:yes stop_codon:yes gene_type:complete
MKTFGLIVSLLLAGFTANAQEVQGITITVVIENVLSDKGTVLGSIHTADTFMKGAGIMSTAAPAKVGEVWLTFENVSPGTYAVMVIHDANDNKQMDMEPNGMPKESYGNTGELAMMGPPTFNASKFEVDDSDLEFRIRF